MVAGAPVFDGLSDEDLEALLKELKDEYRRRSRLLLWPASLRSRPLAASAQVTPPAGGQRQRLELEQTASQGFQRSIQNQLRLDAGEGPEASRESCRSFQDRTADPEQGPGLPAVPPAGSGPPEMGEAEARASFRRWWTSSNRSWTCTNGSKRNF